MGRPLRPMLQRLFALVTGLLLAGAAAAHVSSTGLATLAVQGDNLNLTLTLNPAELGPAAASLLAGAQGDATAAQAAGALLQQHLRARVDGAGGGDCRIARTRLQAGRAGDDRLVALLDFRCPAAPGVLHWHDSLSTPLGEHHRTIASLAHADGSRSEHVLDREHPDLRIDLGRTAPDSVWRFLRLGAGHILSGLDHLLFLAALLIGSHGLRSLLLTVTAFTLAHSAALAAATLGWIQASPAWVEPAIALSIVWVALENLQRQPPAWRRHALTFGFGLVHGLAFAEALTELQLSGWALVRALAGFNGGVELAQAAVVLCLAPLLAHLRARASGPRALRLASLAIGGMGLLWLVQRVGSA